VTAVVLARSVSDIDHTPVGADIGEEREGMPPVEPAVAFACTAPTHQSTGGGPDKLTIHDGQWAFCAFDAQAHGHVWGPTGGRTLTMLRAAALALPKEHAPERSGGT
jgi:hypothetical protein